MTNVRPLHANRDVSRDFNSQKLGHVDAKPKFEAKGHDKQLQEAQYSGRTVEVETISGALRVGTLIRRDRYTITLRHKDGAERMYFKHAIESIEVTAAISGLPSVPDGKAPGETGQ